MKEVCSDLHDAAEEEDQQDDAEGDPVPAEELEVVLLHLVHEPRDHAPGHEERGHEADRKR